MRALVFGDSDAKKRLEAIIHPLVSQLTWQHAAQAQATGHRCLVFDVPLLIESGHWRQKVTQILVVDCTAQTQISRVMARSNLQRSAVESVIAAQASRVQRLQTADAVIFNDGITLEGLRHQVGALASSFGLSLAHLKDSDILA
ncbi:dephospho-CoA kinase [mine drainage metagenome]|uniref:Dephospho-CoA kinase n=1 Tax=mine drainage metagenome TaxID=410659 RepID=A0A1J5P4J5_9ZZZZ